MKNTSNLKPSITKPKKNANETNQEIINNMKAGLSKPTIVEAQRTLKIMQKLIENIGVFQYLDSDFILKFNEVGNPQKSKLNKALVQELSTETYDLLVKEAKLQSQFKPLNNLIEHGEQVEPQKVAEYTRIKKDMEVNFKTLVRQLIKSKNDFEIVKSLRGNTALNNDVQQINESLGNYKIIMQKKLATAAEQEDMHTKILEQLDLKIKSLEKTKQNCQSQLDKLRKDRAAHAQQKKQDIDKLKSQIRDVKTNKQKALQKIKKDNKQMAQALEKQHKSKEEKLMADITTEKNKLQKLKQQNLKEQTTLKGKKTGAEGTLQEYIATYDRQMEVLSKTKTELQRDLKRLSDQLNNFKKHFTEIEIERKREEQLIAAHKKRQEMYELMERRKDEAATRIKRAYKLFKAKSKKKGKKKGKKK